jgi:hypothetical protein
VAKVEVVEPEPEPAVHLEVWAEGHPWCGRRGRELLPGGLTEVDERLDVVIINTRHSVADDADHHRGVARGEKISRAHPRERPQHHVAEVLHGDRRAGPRAAVHRDPYLRELVGSQASRHCDLLPRVHEEALERAAPPAHDAGLEPHQEVLGEVHREVPDLIHGERAVRVQVVAPELGVPVVKRRCGSVAGDGDDGGAVGDGGGEGGRVGAHRGGPSGEEEAHGLPVGDKVLGHGADHQPPAREPRQLRLEERLIGTFLIDEPVN